MSYLLISSLIILVISLLLLLILTMRGKTILDRVLTLDLIAIAAIGLFIILYLRQDDRFYLDIAQLLAIVGFVTALVFATFLPDEEV